MLQLESLNLDLTPALQVHAPFVLLEDTSFVRIVWKSRADSDGINLRIYESPHELLSQLHFYNSETIFYLDLDLGMGCKLDGIDVARVIKKKLGARVFMVSGCHPDYFTDFHVAGIIDGVFGKDYIAGTVVNPIVPEILKSRKQDLEPPKPVVKLPVPHPLTLSVLVNRITKWMGLL